MERRSSCGETEEYLEVEGGWEGVWGNRTFARQLVPAMTYCTKSQPPLSPPPTTTTTITTTTHDDEDEDGDNDSWVCERDCIGRLLPRQQIPLLLILLVLLLLLHLVGFTTITSIMTNTKMQWLFVLSCFSSPVWLLKEFVKWMATHVVEWGLVLFLGTFNDVADWAIRLIKPTTYSAHTLLHC